MSQVRAEVTASREGDHLLCIVLLYFGQQGNVLDSSVCP